MECQRLYETDIPAYCRRRRPANPGATRIIWVQQVRVKGENESERDSYLLGEGTLHVDDRGEEWVETEGGDICPGCLAHDFAGLRVYTSTGINPFTDAPFTVAEMEDGDLSWGSRSINEVPALGRPLVRHS